MDVGALLQHSQYAIPIGIVLACAILVFVFGFKNAEQPPFAQLTSGSDVDRKPAGKKRNKIKEKVRATNGQVTTEKASPAKKVVPVKTEAVKKSAAKTEEAGIELKERRHEENKPVVARKEKTIVAPKSGKENKVELVKNRKNLKNNSQDKPVDFDDGDWEPAYSRKEKKNKKKDDETPPKRNKKEGKKNAEVIGHAAGNEKDQGKPEVKDKVAKDTENKELKEKDKKELVLVVDVVDAEPVIEALENKEKEEELEEIEKLEKPEKIEKAQKIEKMDKIEKVEKVEKVEKIEKVEKMEKPEKTEEKKSGKVKKTKKAVESENIPPTFEPPSLEKQEKVVEKLVEEDKKIKSEAAEERKVEKVQENNSVVFDELGDSWTEAKPQKKSKKKARKDN